MVSCTRRIILILLGAAAVYLAGNARVSLFDRDEPRYAQCSRQMLRSGDWVVPRLYDEIRAQKPPLIYWCQATAMRIFGDDSVGGTFAARFPSSLAMLLTLTVLAIALWRGVSPRHAVWTIFILATSLMTIVSAKVCLTDSVLLLFTTIAQLCLYSIHEGNRNWTPVLLMAVMLGLGGLTKGPFILGTVGCTAIVLAIFYLFGRTRGTIAPPERSSTPDIFAYRSIQTLVGVLIIAAIVGPWLYLVYHRAPEFLVKATAEAKAHLEQGKEGHNLPPGYHFVLIWVTFFPWSFLLPIAIGLAIRHRRDPQIRFALAAVIGPWLMIEFMGTKLPHYILSVFPALSFLTASAVIRCIDREEPDMQHRSFQIGAGCWAVGAILMSVVPWLLVPGFKLPGIHPPKFTNQPYFGLIAYTSAGIVYAIAVFSLVRLRRYSAAMAATGIGMMVAVVIGFTLYLGQAQFLRTSVNVAGVLKKVRATGPDSVVMIDYKEPSLGFYQGGTIREEKTSFLNEKHWELWPHWLVLTRQAWEKAPEESRQRLQLLHDPILPCRGWAYSDGGRTVEILVAENRASKK